MFLAAIQRCRADLLMKVALNFLETRQSWSRSIGCRYITIYPKLSELRRRKYMHLYLEEYVERDVEEGG